MKHILIFFLSELHVRDNVLPKSIYTRTNGTEFTVIQTNETAIRALADTLAERDEHIDCIFYFLSSRVKGTITYISDEGREETTTQEEFFVSRIRREYGDIPCVPIAFDETQHPEMGVEQVTHMAQAITDYVYRANWKIADVLLHADMTGGPRNAAMMMLSVMQLLKYDGFRAGEVLYGYKNGPQVHVEHATDVYRMFNLVSGADEFVNFGSVEEIERYFADREKSTELETLLRTMRDFSDAIRICRPAIMRKTVANLQQALEGFEQKGNKTLPELLFSNILKLFRREYKDLLKPQIERLDIIKWCVRKGFIQQAMTLCTEWLPTYIVERQICYPISADIEAVCKDKKYEWNTWHQYFINQFYRKKKQTMPAVSGKQNKKKKRQAIADALLSYEINQDADQAIEYCPELKKALRQFFGEYTMAQFMFRQSKNPSCRSLGIQRHAPLIYKTLQLLWQRTCRMATYNKDFAYFLERFKIDRLFAQLSNLSLEEFAMIFVFDVEKSVPAQVVSTTEPVINYDLPVLQGEAKWIQRGRQYQRMLAYGIIGSAYDAETMLTILKDFFWIRTTRNSINHAEDSAISTARDISTLITKAIERLEQLERV